MVEYNLGHSALGTNEIYSAIFKIWCASSSILISAYFSIRSVGTILLPFFLLAFINARIVIAIQKTEFQFISAQKLSDAKRKVRKKVNFNCYYVVPCKSCYQNSCFDCFHLFDVQHFECHSHHLGIF